MLKKNSRWKNRNLNPSGYFVEQICDKNVKKQCNSAFLISTLRNFSVRGKIFVKKANFPRILLESLYLYKKMPLESLYLYILVHNCNYNYNYAYAYAYSFVYAVKIVNAKAVEIVNVVRVVRIVRVVRVVSDVSVVKVLFVFRFVLVLVVDVDVQVAHENEHENEHERIVCVVYNYFTLLRSNLCYEITLFNFNPTIIRDYCYLIETNTHTNTHNLFNFQVFKFCLSIASANCSRLSNLSIKNSAYRICDSHMHLFLRCSMPVYFPKNRAEVPPGLKQKYTSREGKNYPTIHPNLYPYQIKQNPRIKLRTLLTAGK